jgi:hypothetical protein
MPMVNVKELGLPAAPALKGIPDQDLFPVSAEVIPRVPAHPITLRAQAGDGGDSLTTDAKQRLLPKASLYRSGQEVFRTAVEG